MFRKGIDAVDLYLSISGLAYFFLSNQHTLSWLLDRDLAPRPRAGAVSTSSRWCLPMCAAMPPTAPK